MYQREAVNDVHTSVSEVELLGRNVTLEIAIIWVHTVAIRGMVARNLMAMSPRVYWEQTILWCRSDLS